MVTPVTEPARLRQLCAGSQGFVYAVTMTGTTGRQVAVPEELIGYLERVRASSPLPVCAGFGIRSREQVERLRGHVDGVVIGSALVEVLERGEEPAAWLRHWASIWSAALGWVALQGAGARPPVPAAASAAADTHRDRRPHRSTDAA